MKTNWLKDFARDSLETKKCWITLKDIVTTTAILLCMAGVLIWCSNQERVMSVSWLYRYFAVVILELVVLFVVQFYFQKKMLSSSERAKNRIVKTYEIMCIVLLILGIPMLVMIKIISIILSYRAKKFENLMYSGCIILLNLFIIIAFLRPNCSVAEISTECIVKQFSGVHWNTYAVSLMLYLSLYVVELNVANYMILRAMHHHGKTLLNKETLEKYRKCDKCETDKEEEIYQEQGKRREALEYDVEYHKKTLWKFQLICLIVLFAIGFFAPEEITNQQSDFVNVLTWFTILMLYWDKRKAWK